MDTNMDTRMTTYEIHLALCVETVDIWNNPKKVSQLCYADMLDDYNQILEPHAFNDTNPSAEEWDRVIAGLSFLQKAGLKISAIVKRAKTLAAHPEYFDAELNKEQRIAYDKHWDKSCIEYHTKATKKKVNKP